MVCTVRVALPGMRVARRRAARRIAAVRAVPPVISQPMKMASWTTRRGVWAALFLVGVEEPLVGVALHDQCELPGEVGRVADAGAHALSDERRGQVGGVAEQEHPAVAPAVGDDAPEGVGGLPQEGQLVDVHPDSHGRISSSTLAWSKSSGRSPGRSRNSQR